MGVGGKSGLEGGAAGKAEALKTETFYLPNLLRNPSVYIGGGVCMCVCAHASVSPYACPCVFAHGWKILDEDT